MGIVFFLHLPEVALHLKRSPTKYLSFVPHKCAVKAVQEVPKQFPEVLREAPLLVSAM